jgi:hypothetical protein
MESSTAPILGSTFLQGPYSKGLKLEGEKRPAPHEDIGKHSPSFDNTLSQGPLTWNKGLTWEMSRMLSATPHSGNAFHQAPYCM